jgi:hypothetical protein
MLVRIVLAALLVLGIGTSMFYSYHEPAYIPAAQCCGLDPPF